MNVLRLASHVDLVWLHPVSDPPPTEWDACMERIEQLKVELQGADGREPRAAQSDQAVGDTLGLAVQ